ncbi:uncharacterized protein LOC114190508 [Vigna unguiculata]|uniref:uncharacterized protein LOC114190508 n=1 Tax=Vigna unguiculata TaxID=3917 RepID=UPI0010170FC6|nr:uncharacterized protein LOC114190508 [Vigna unguiculata]XP_027935223.1 uncharacterized protein LOC114190508 [Vigna unguiculata]
MMSQQQNQNLPAVPQSLLQQTGFEDAVKPFSLRQYVLASRHRNFFQNWPFHEKHLWLCLKHGLKEKEVLPPFGSQTSLTEPLKDSANLMHYSSSDNNNNSKKEADSCKAEYDYHPQAMKNDCDYKVKEGNEQHCSNISANLSQPSSTHAHKISSLMQKAVKDKCRRRKGRCKKRSMVDILAVARHSTLEEIHMMNKFYYAETKIEEYQQTVPYGSEDAYDGDMAPKGPLLLKFKLNGCNVNGYCRT